MAIALKLAASGGQLKQIQAGDSIEVDSLERRSASGNVLVGSLLGASDEVRLGTAANTTRIMNDLAIDGNLDMTAGNITNVNQVDGVDVSSHGSRHIRAGNDEIDGDKLDIDWNPTNYTPTTSPSEVDHIDELTAHLAGIDAELAAGGVSGPVSSTDEAITRWDGTGGDTLQDSGVTIDDTDHVKGVETLTYDAEYDNGNSGTAKTITWGNGQKQKLTLTGNVTITFVAPAGPGHFTLKLVQDATGGYTITWPSTVKWPNGVKKNSTLLANQTSVWTCYYDGTNYYADMGGGFAGFS